MVTETIVRNILEDICEPQLLIKRSENDAFTALTLVLFFETLIDKSKINEILTEQHSFLCLTVEAVCDVD